MVGAPNFTVSIDTDAVKAQVAKAIDEAMVQASMRLRTAADQLDPDFLKYHEEWIESRIEQAVLKERAKYEKTEKGND